MHRFHRLTRALIAALVALLVAANLPAPASAATWNGTWGASPQSGSNREFSNQTLRQIVRTSIGGTAVRVQLSNAFGTRALTVSNVHVARRTSGSSVDAASDRLVTFGGQQSVTIPIGGLAISDAASVPVAASSDLAVSFHLPSATGPATYHQTALQTSYIAAGNVAGNASITPTGETGDNFILSGVDVDNPAGAGTIVALGASIVDGVASSHNANRRWPNLLSDRLNASGRTVGVVNQGISGNQLLRDGAGQSAINRFERDVLNQTGVKWVVFADNPINDVGSNRPVPTAQQLITGAQNLVDRAHARGIQFICATLTPFQGANYWTQEGENSRAAYNAWVRSAGSGCDRVVDFDAATRDPANPTRFLPAYDPGDHLHPNDAGFQAMANAFDLAWFGATSGTPGIQLRSRANNQLVNAGPTLVANGTATTFDRIDLGNGNIALRSRANNLYVAAEAAGAQPLVANRTAVGPWETFQVVNNPNGTISLRAQANGNYVCADGGGAQPLIANRTAVGPWEQFDVVNV
ncbi:GDSL-type esterase/lipase family protein [Herbidospora cretacea]|uniref:GDSL-type esterase/lipase family protein n=1 Tax=Herbidospora cretacea TaxID=28444 RepID=UPI0007C6E119|nr:GDSL-type esterase/lipase family protein [Herbidospora cretacea]